MKGLKALSTVTVLLAMSAQTASALDLILENKTGKELHELYFAPAGDDDWGPDQLADKTVPSGQNFTLTSIPKGKYDVLFMNQCAPGVGLGVRMISPVASSTARNAISVRPFSARF